MRTSSSMKRVMIFVDETDKFQRGNLRRRTFGKAKKGRLQRCHSPKRICRFRSHKQIHTNSIVDLAVSLPDIGFIYRNRREGCAAVADFGRDDRGRMIAIDDVETIKLSKK